MGRLGARGVGASTTKGTMMGYWTSTQQRYGIRERANHPWAVLLRKTLAQVAPATLGEFEADGELDAYLSVKVDECEKSIRTMVAQGMERDVAREIAMQAMLPQPEEEVAEDWEKEGADADAIDALEEWINARSQQDVEDR